MNKTINKNTRTIRWIARILGTILAVYLVFTTVGGFIINFGNLTASELIAAYGSTAFIAVFVAGVIVAWFREKIGGIILVVSAVAVSIFSIIYGLAPNSDLLMLILIAGLPFLIIGILFLVYWWKSRKLSTSQ